MALAPRCGVLTPGAQVTVDMGALAVAPGTLLVPEGEPALGGVEACGGLAPGRSS